MAFDSWLFDDPNDPTPSSAMDPQSPAGMGTPTGPFTGGVTGAGTNPVSAPTQPRAYNPMSGWDAGKLNGDADSLKYQFGRFVQDRGFDPISARQNLGGIVDQWNQFSGGNARALGDDRIDFGQSYGPVDVLNGGNYWQWGAWSDPNQQPSASGPTSLSGLMGVTGSTTGQSTAPTWQTMTQNASAYGQSPLATVQRKPASTLSQLLGGQ